LFESGQTSVLKTSLSDYRQRIGLGKKAFIHGCGFYLILFKARLEKLLKFCGAPK